MENLIREEIFSFTKKEFHFPKLGIIFYKYDDTNLNTEENLAFEYEFSQMSKENVKLLNDNLYFILKEIKAAILKLNSEIDDDDIHNLKSGESEYDQIFDL